MNDAATYASLLLRMTSDQRITARHISLATALFICWHAGDFQNPFSVCRKKLMTLAKIASAATYHKCIRQLDQYGYVCYQPSYHPVKGSLVRWLVRENETENKRLHSR